MKAISVRGIPNDVYAGLVALASENGRSLQQQVKLILEKEAKLYKIGTLNRMKSWRRKLSNRDWGNISDEIRSEREKR
jgi:hypothetical protein